jgi:hypothetical protein
LKCARSFIERCWKEGANWLGDVGRPGLRCPIDVSGFEGPGPFHPTKATTLSEFGHVWAEGKAEPDSCLTCCNYSESCYVLLRFATSCSNSISEQVFFTVEFIAGVQTLGLAVFFITGRCRLRDKSVDVGIGLLLICVCS